MGRFLLFVDGSVDPRLKIGYGCYLLLPAELVSQLTPAGINERLKTKRFDSTSSSRLEIETLLWALKETEKTIDKENEIVVYTDSQNIMGLKDRRKRLEGKNYQKKKAEKYLRNIYLYQEYFRLTDRLNCRLIKVSGHSKISEKDIIDKIFLEVDRSSRRTLRKYIAEN